MRPRRRTTRAHATPPSQRLLKGVQGTTVPCRVQGGARRCAAAAAPHSRNMRATVTAK